MTKTGIGLSTEGKIDETDIKATTMAVKLEMDWVTADIDMEEETVELTFEGAEGEYAHEEVVNLIEFLKKVSSTMVSGGLNVDI